MKKIVILAICCLSIIGCGAPFSFSSDEEGHFVVTGQVTKQVDNSGK